MTKNSTEKGARFRGQDWVRLVDPNRPGSAVEGTLAEGSWVYFDGGYGVYNLILEDGRKYRSEGILERVEP